MCAHACIYACVSINTRVLSRKCPISTSILILKNAVKKFKSGRMNFVKPIRPAKWTTMTVTTAENYLEEEFLQMFSYFGGKVMLEIKSS